MPIMTAVTVDADTLERLVRSAHEWDENYSRCRCGWAGHVGLPGRSTDIHHGNHVDYQVREALAGRLDWP